MARYCECGDRIVVYMKRKGWVAPPDREHDQCGRCWKETLKQFG